MTLSGTDYLMSLAAIAVAFVGFSMVVVALRQATGAELSNIHLHFVRVLIEGSLAVTAFSLVPGALSYTSLAIPPIWRLSSAAAAAGFSVYLVVIIRRRRRVSTAPIPLSVIINMTISSLATLLLVANAAGFPFEPNSGAYVVALTWFMVLNGLIFLQNLEVFVRPSGH